MNKKRCICVFTGNRSEYGLLYPFLKALATSKEADLKLIVSGAHLDQKFGNTILEIEKDGFNIAAKIKISFEMNQLSSTPKAIGSAILSISEALEDIKPDIFVVYGDRFEGFAAAIAASQMSIPTAHIEGGDITEGGTFDDSVRHAITKLSHLHLATNQEAANRILAMGEELWRVHNIGFPGLDLIKDGRVASRDHLTSKYNLDLSRPIVLFTQHPVSVEIFQTKYHIEASLRALSILTKQNIQVIVIYPNNDIGSQEIIESITAWQSQELCQNIQVHKSLEQAHYYGILSLANDHDKRVACVGNSSSGIKETPAFLCPTVNIGMRQKGRLRAKNVLNAQYDTKDIVEKVNTALFDEEFRVLCRNTVNPYGTAGASNRIKDIILNIELGARLLTKKMTLGAYAHV